MKIVLIGYRASGKTTVGRLLSQHLGWPYMDVDRGIEGHCGKSIKEIYEQDGNQYYRDVESQVTAEMCRYDRCVIAFGAGTIMRPVNQNYAGRNSLVVYLEAEPKELWRRMQADSDSEKNRPDLSRGGLEEVVEMLGQRAVVYRHCADLILDGTLLPEHLADQIVARVNQDDSSKERDAEG